MPVSQNASDIRSNDTVLVGAERGVVLGRFARDTAPSYVVSFAAGDVRDVPAADVRRADPSPRPARGPSGYSRAA